MSIVMTVVGRKLLLPVAQADRALICTIRWRNDLKKSEFRVLDSGSRTHDILLTTGA